MCQLPSATLGLQHPLCAPHSSRIAPPGWPWLWGPASSLLQCLVQRNLFSRIVCLAGWWVDNKLWLRKTTHLKITVKPQMPSRTFPHVVLLANLCRNQQHGGDDHQLVKNGDNEAQRNECLAQGYVGKTVLKVQLNRRSAFLMMEIRAPSTGFRGSCEGMVFSWQPAEQRDLGLPGSMVEGRTSAWSASSPRGSSYVVPMCLFGLQYSLKPSRWTDNHFPSIIPHDFPRLCLRLGCCSPWNIFSLSPTR